MKKELIHWKNSPERKPLILSGARQVGKTWILKDFAKTEYRDYVYINCDNNTFVKSLFRDYDTDRIIRALSAVSGKRIQKNETVVILDEIQEVPNGLTALKYFCEDAPEYHIVVAGSLLGIQMHKGTGYPVGKVDKLILYPLSFDEFLTALGKEELSTYLEECRWEEYNYIKDILTEYLRQYFYVGGMPQAVSSYIKKGDLSEVRSIQNSILKDYEDDFSKHIPENELPKIQAVWNSIPSQLAKENKKFIWGVLRKGARAKEFENAVQWLIQAGLVHKVTRVKSVEAPLKFYEDSQTFKLFFNDIGLLGAMSGITAKDVLFDWKMITEYKGMFTEQYIAQQFWSTLEEKLFYYTNENSTSEIDFVFCKENLYPVEVKAEENLKSKSLSTVLKTNPNLKALRFSMSNYREQEQLTNVPLGLAPWFFRNLDKE